MNKIQEYPVLRSIGRALPLNYYDQQTLTSALWDAWRLDPKTRAHFDRFHSTGVRGRHLALPLEEYGDLLDSFAKTNDKWIERATELSEEAVLSALSQAKLAPTDIDHIFLTTFTGIAAPGIDAKLINRLSMRSDIRRTPIFGLGCAGGVAGIARGADYIRAFPTHAALLVSVELCSLTLQRKDRSIANVIASGLFGDGAAAAIILGHDRANDSRSPKIIASRSVFFPDTENMMAWKISDTGFQLVLSAQVPDLIRNNLRDAADSFLDEFGLSRRSIRHWIAHTGGPKVLKAMEEALEIPGSALECSWQSLASIGNLSSASVLFVAAEFLESDATRPGDYGILLSMGPGFGGELVLVQW